MSKPSPKQTPMMQQWETEKARHPDAILFFRMGDFYEMFGEDAVRCAELLDLTLTSRSKGADAMPMAGIPHHQLERYLREMIAHGQKVAICDQLEDPATAKGIVKRGVTRVVTPGTVLEDSCLQSHSNNFLAAVCEEKDTAGLACIDVSTGEFFVSEIPLETLGDELERLAPAETLVPREGMAEGNPLPQALTHRAVGVLTRREGFAFTTREAEVALKAHFHVQSLDGFGLTDAPQAVRAAGAVLAYLHETQKMALPHIRGVRRIQREDHLILDRTTQRNLELTHPLQEGTKSRTLLGVLDKTRTGPGGRLLRSWLLRPLCRVEAIRQRQAAISELMEDILLRTELRETLAGIADLERIMARVTTARAGPRDLWNLAKGIRQLPLLQTLATRMQAELLCTTMTGLDPLTDVADGIEAALVEDPPTLLRDGGFIRTDYHPELADLRAVRTGGKDWIASFRTAEQARSGIPSLKIGFNKVFGYYIEVTNTHRDKIPDDYIRKQTLTNAERFITPELKEREQLVLGAEERIAVLEQELFVQLRTAVAGEVARVQETARTLAVLDALSALAECGTNNRYVMPEVHEGIETVFEAGRHPVLETLLPDGDFIPNTTRFDPDSALIHIITGPNMAGKSTYIRQTALLTILAHMGAPIPAASARVGLTDRIFTRVGAADDLARGQSTFMVEMAETANILHNATARSLVILDEVGRGTSTFDGVSLAWAITEYLHHKVSARTLFATHYHELAELGLILDKADNQNVGVRDWGGEIIFLHKIQPGSCDRSYGIQVARLAGLPMGVVERAREILLGLEGQAADRDWNLLHEGEVLRAAAREVQLDLFAPQAAKNDRIVEELSRLDLNHMTPMQALQAMQDLVERAKRQMER